MNLFIIFIVIHTIFAINSFDQTSIVSNLKDIQEVSKMVGSTLPSDPEFISKFSQSMVDISSFLGKLISQTSSFGQTKLSLAARSLQKIILEQVGPSSSKFLVRWGFLLVVSTRTTGMMYNLYLYDSFFQESGSQYNNYKAEISRISDLILRNVDIVESLGSLNKYFSSDSVEILFERFERNSVLINQGMDKVRRGVEEIMREIVTEKDDYQKKRKNSVINAIGSSVWVVGSLAISAVFPPSIPWIVASKTSSILGLSLSGLNMGIAYFTKKNIERMKYRLDQFSGIEEDIFLLTNQTEGLLVEFTSHKKNVLKILSERSFYERAIVSFLNVLTNVKVMETANMVISKIIESLSLILMVFLSISIFKYYKNGNFTSIKLSHLLKITGLLMMFLVFSFFINLGLCFEKDRKIEIENRMDIKRINRRLAEQKYQAECIIYELPLSTQMSMDLKSTILSIFGIDSYRRKISTNSTGHFVSDPKCNSYSRKILTSSKNDMKYVASNVNSKAELIKTIIDNSMEILIKSVNKFVDNTNLTTKLWCLGVVFLWGIVVLKFVL